jgi:hypothetical protein
MKPIHSKRIDFTQPESAEIKLASPKFFHPKRDQKWKKQRDYRKPAQLLRNFDNLVPYGCLATKFFAFSISEIGLPRLFITSKITPASASYSTG